MRVKHAVCYAVRDSGRSKHVAQAMSEGMRRHGWSAEVMTGFHSGAKGDLAIGYGWIQRRIFDAYAATGKPYLYCDMGYWNRKPQGAPRDGHHKLVLNGWCPAKTMRHGMPADRFRRLNIPVETYAPGPHVVIAGMSAKSALDHGLAVEQWERETVARLRASTQRELLYRPKPSWEGAKPIEGTTLDDIRQPIQVTLKQARMLVTHHSNAAIDALAAGVPYHCQSGAALRLSQPLATLDAASPSTEGERKALLADIAYLQWTPAEMRSGAAWDYYRGLVCT